MKHSILAMNRSLIALLCSAIAGCAAPGESAPLLRYAGSSTIAHFIRDAEPVYARARFLVDTEPESGGAEAAILEGRADLAGLAGVPRQETLERGVQATLLARDAIAVIVNHANPVSSLGRAQLRDIFTGKAKNWREFGGPDRAILPCIVGPESATRRVFRAAVLGESDYGGCTVVRPDDAMVARVAQEPGAIGQISFSFFSECGEVHALAVDGETPVPTNPDYPITRPLYLLTWPGRASVESFVSWARSPAGEAVLARRFARASVAERSEPTGGKP